MGLVIPTGYSFNLDGTSIYLTMAAVFIAQATNTHMDIMHQVTLLVVLLLSSKVRQVSQAVALSCWPPPFLRLDIYLWLGWH